VSILYENLTSMKAEEAYEDHIKKPLLRRPIPKDVEIQAEDEQNFLARMQSILNTQTPTSGGSQQTTPSSRPTESPSPVLPRSQPKSVGGASSPTVQPPQMPSGQLKKPEAKLTSQAPGTTQEGVLAQFFNNLLQKKSGAVGEKQFGSTENAAAAAAELESSYGKIPDRPPTSNANNHVAVNDSATESAS